MNPYMEFTHKTDLAYSAMCRPLCRELKLTQTAFDILLFLANNPGHDTASDIVELRRIKANLVSVNVNRLVEEGYLDKAALDDEAANENEIVDALYRGLKGSPCKLMAASIVDAVGEKRTQNQPGTNNEYPNWRIPLADGEGNVVPLEKLFDEPRLQEITAIMRG